MFVRYYSLDLVMFLLLLVGKRTATRRIDGEPVVMPVEVLLANTLPKHHHYLEVGPRAHPPMG